ncbi:MAG: sensor histidine kinase [Verrucomicrobiota bacterium]
MPSQTFTVDTHLFRELGEMLVGRESTALVELIKNAYDADAEEVIVHGENLDNPNLGVIKIVDDGVGMTPAHFKSGFLRIASRIKEAGQRLSVRYHRRFTGAKGIGRLAAHKLAKHLRVHSIPGPEITDGSAFGVDASIDWDIVEQQETLDDLFGTNAVQVNPEPIPTSGKGGTMIELRRLRRKWTPAERARFFAEVGAYKPAEALVDPPNRVVTHPLLFERPNVADTRPTDPGFTVKLTGDFEAGDDYWPALVQAAQWIIEIKSDLSDGKVHINVIPTKRGETEFPNAKPLRTRIDHPNSKGGPFFQARILVREGGGGTRSEKAWLGRSSGIRVFMEGFRVLPYGEPNDDWLSIDADYKKRQKTLTYLSALPMAEKPADENEGLLFLGNSAYFGAVFLTLAKAPNLKMLVNREGFVPGAELDALVDILRTTIYLSVRTRASAKQQSRQERSEKRKQQTLDAVEPSKLELRRAVEASVNRASELAQEARRCAAAGDIATAQGLISKAGHEFSAASSTSQRLMTEGSMLRVLASVGTQMAAFVHEINGLLGAAISLEEAIFRLRKDPDISASGRKQMAQLNLAIGDLRRSVERQAVYLTDVISPDARRRRSRQKLAERFDAGKRLIEGSSQKRDIDITNNIPVDLKSPPMFPAETTLIFSNLLTNAVKAAGEHGRINADARTTSNGGVQLRIENTGVAVDLDEAERWFKPFESTTVQTDPALGQGMGMGLPITRSILEEYGADIRFVRPSHGFATAIEITFQE